MQRTLPTCSRDKSLMEHIGASGVATARMWGHGMCLEATLNSWENEERKLWSCLWTWEKFVGKRTLSLLFLPSEHRPRKGLGDIWGGEAFYWSWGNSGQLTQRQLFQRSTKDQGSNDLSLTLEKPCFYSCLWEYGSKCLFLSGTQMMEFTWGRLAGQPASWEACQREGTFLNIADQPASNCQKPISDPRQKRLLGTVGSSGKNRELGADRTVCSPCHLLVLWP